MKISNIVNVNTTHNAFGRAIRPEEETDYHNTLQEGKSFLGIKNMAIILHGSSFPVAANDLFIGSPINKKAAETNDFLKMHGFDSVQLGPPGLIQRDDPSPYTSSINSRNYLFTDMEQLTRSQYGSILKTEDIKSIADKNYINNSNKTGFDAAFKAYDVLFEKAYENLIEDIKLSKPDAVILFSKFQKFKENNENWLESDAMFEILSNVNGNDDFDNWSDMDKNLITYLKDEKNPHYAEAKNFKNTLMKDNGKELDLYKFKQFIVKTQEKEFANKKDKLNYMSDAIIGFSPRDVWANQEAFLKNYMVGCPYGGEGEAINWSPWGSNQVWDIPLVDPKKLFNPDGSVGVGGKLIQEKFRSLLENHQNIRIDHVLGLVDPWVYDRTRLNVEKDGDKVLHTTAYGANISKFGKPNAYRIENHWGQEQKDIHYKINDDVQRMPNIDPDGNYKRLLHEILLPVIKEKGLKTNDVAWENLGSPTDVFNEVCYGQNGKREPGDNRDIIPGMSSLKSYRGEDEARTVPDNCMLIQSHDDEATGELLTNKFYEEKKKGVMDPNYLIGALYPDLPANTGDKNYVKWNNSDEGKEEKWENTKDYLINERMPNNTDTRTLVKYQELVRYGKNIQFTFMDFFGLGDRYNYSGTKNPLNWKLRLPQSYKEDYYKTLERSKQDDGKDPTWWKHIAINMPELLKRAVISKAMNEGKDIETIKPLVKKLDHYEKILYESSTPSNDTLRK